MLLLLKGMVKIKEKDIMTLDQAPWIEYLVIDSKTGARKLKKDTPKEIKDAQIVNAPPLDFYELKSLAATSLILSLML